MARDSNALGRPRNLREAAAVEAALRKKYPAMTSDPEWGKPKRKKAKRKDESLAGKIKQRQRASELSLNEALTGEEIRRMVGR